MMQNLTVIIFKNLNKNSVNGKWWIVNEISSSGNGLKFLIYNAITLCKFLKYEMTIFNVNFSSLSFPDF